MATHNEESLFVGKLEPSSRAKSFAHAGIFLGILTFLIGVFKFSDQVWPAYLTAFFYFSCFALGGLFFIAINYIASAGWSVSVRRIAESMTAFLPVMLIGSIVLLFGLKKLYPWADAERMATDSLLQVKAPYLNYPFFLVRMLVFGVGSLWFAKMMVGNSIKQDSSGDANLTHQNQKFSIAFIFFFALLFSLFSVDLLMTLLPHWYSTIFGIYTFAGLIQGTFALMVLLTLWAKNSGSVRGYINMEHVHDLAKFTKGFTVFWAYIAFSQFMLIWYANIPEETEFYLLRGNGSWLALSLILLIFKFIVPFIALLPRGAKRSEGHLKLVCGLILVMQYLDIYWLVYPNFSPEHVTFGWLEIGMVLGFGGLFFASIFKFFATNKPVAVKDPRMHEALSHHVTY